MPQCTESTGEIQAGTVGPFHVSNSVNISSIYYVVFLASLSASDFKASLACTCNELTGVAVIVMLLPVIDAVPILDIHVFLGWAAILA